MNSSEMSIIFVFAKRSPIYLDKEIFFAAWELLLIHRRRTPGKIRLKPLHIMWRILGYRMAGCAQWVDGSRGVQVGNRSKWAGRGDFVIRRKPYCGMGIFKVTPHVIRPDGIASVMFHPDFLLR